MDSGALWGGLGYLLGVAATLAAALAGVGWLSVAKDQQSLPQPLRDAARLTGYAFLLAAASAFIIGGLSIGGQ